MSASETLELRGKSYGDFQSNARIAQAIKAVLRDSPNWAALPADMKEAMEHIASKLGRLLNGDPQYIDSWHDISGYAQLIEARLRSNSPSEVPRET